MLVASLLLVALASGGFSSLAAVASVPPSAPPSLAQLLSAMRFQNLGTTHSDSAFAVATVPCGYLEPENVTTPEFAWSVGSKCPFVFLDNSSKPAPGPAPATQCKLGGEIKQQTNAFKGDLKEAIPPTASAEACVPLCCENEGCVGFVFSPTAPAKMGGCKEGGPCCYLKNNEVAEPTHSTLPGIAYGKISGHGSQSNADLIPPPLGIRSAVPLGGIGAGSMELRGDGSLQQLTIWNNYPAGAPKFWSFPDAVFGMRVGGSSNGDEQSDDAAPPAKAVALRTSPPEGIPGVAALKYSGAYPMTRLAVEDESLPGTKTCLSHAILW